MEEGVTDRGDCPQINMHNFTLPLTPLPVRKEVGATPNVGEDTGVALNGVPIFDSYEAGGKTLDDAHIVQDLCHGHTTPGMTERQYHYHRAPHCGDDGLPYQDEPTAHSPLLGFAMDGFGIYGHQDEGGSGDICTVACEDEFCEDDCSDPDEICHCGQGWWTGDSFCRTSGDTGTCERSPAVDECGGHFGPTTPGDAAHEYHYHIRTSPPYTLTCFGPSWGVCPQPERICNSECPEVNVVDELCVATGFQSNFHIDEIAFGDGYSGGDCGNFCGDDGTPTSPEAACSGKAECDACYWDFAESRVSDFCNIQGLCGCQHTLDAACASTEDCARKHEVTAVVVAITGVFAFAVFAFGSTRLYRRFCVTGRHRLFQDDAEWMLEEPDSAGDQSTAKRSVELVTSVTAAAADHDDEACI